MRTVAGKYSAELKKRLGGFTVLELLAVTTIALIVVMMGASTISSTRRFSIEERAVQNLKQLADAEERFRFSSDVTVNPEGTYATFGELQLAGYVPADLVEDDVRAHTVSAFVPYYRINIVRSPNDPLNEPDANGYYVVALPIPSRMHLKTYYMLEDGEVWHSYGLKYFER